ncbi:MAG: sugar ABC transporter permease [Spirochaetales bacterium]|nr:sugar ABC transporter permease [Spirochaetales bacterium]
MKLNQKDIEVNIINMNYVKNTKKKIKVPELHIMIMPGIILLFIFVYVPMWGIIIAFQDYKLHKGFSQAEWVGMKHFISLFTDRAFPRVLLNTLVISLKRLFFLFPTPIILALMLNEIKVKKFKSVLQTISYLPHFISWVIAAGFIFSFLAVDGGDLNGVMMWMGIIDEPLNFLSRPDWFHTILISSNIWKTTGFGAIVYLAAIAGVDPALYEAAQMDGLNRFKQTIHITLPSIVPVIIVYLILTLASILTVGFEDILLLTKQMNNAILRSKADVIDTYVFRMGLSMGRYSYATAAGLFKGLVSVVLLWLGNRMAKALGRNSLW